MSDIEKPDVIGATRRAETIRQGMISYAAALEAIGEAYENRDWVALGHKDWDTYCEKEFSERRLKLTREQREQAVLAFRGAGMSIRAIGSALGVSVNTVQKDLSQSDTPAAITGADGKTYAASRPAQTEPPADPLSEFPAAEQALNDFLDKQTSGLVGTSPVDESGEDRPATAEPGEAEDGGPSSAADVPIPSAPRTGDDSSAEEFVPVDGRGQPEPVGVTGPAAPDPDEDDDERGIFEWRQRVSEDLMRALASIKMRLEPDPVAWMEKVYVPGSYHAKDMPQVRDCYSPEAIRLSAQYLFELAEYLEMNGVEL